MIKSMRLLLATVSAMAAMSALAPAHAETADQERWPRWYLGVSGGVTFLSDSDIKGAGTGRLSYNDGGFGTLALGYMPPLPGPFLNNLRFEAEGGYHYNSLDGLRLNGVNSDARGHIQAFSYMGNVYYDLRNNSQWTPYAGAGAGGARISIGSGSGIGNTGRDSNVFAYQFMAGLSFAPTSIPMTEWSVGYRYFATEDPEFTSPTGKVKLDGLESSNIEVGAKFRF